MKKLTFIEWLKLIKYSLDYKIYNGFPYNKQK